MHGSSFIEDPEMIQRNSSLLVAALDELSDLTRALGKDVELQITRNNSNLLSLLVTHMEHPHAGVRQSVYALAGNMAGNCFSLLKPHVPKIIKQTLLQPDWNSISKRTHDLLLEDLQVRTKTLMYQIKQKWSSARRLAL